MIRFFSDSGLKSSPVIRAIPVINPTKPIAILARLRLCIKGLNARAADPNIAEPIPAVPTHNRSTPIIILITNKPTEKPIKTFLNKEWV